MLSFDVKILKKGGPSPSDQWKIMTWQALKNIRVKLVRPWQEANCFKTGRAPWPERRHKAEFASGGSDAMQIKRKKLGQGRVSMKSLKGTYFEVELQGKLQTGLSIAGRLKKGCIWTRPEMAQSMAVNNQRPHVEGARVKTSWYSYNQGKSQDSNPNLKVFY